jgi:uncharacterized protein YqgC (DUF456 family)
MDILLLILGILLLIAGIAGGFLPALPGPPFSFAGMLLIHFTQFAQFQTLTLFISGIAVILVQVMDYVIPAWGTKRFGGSKYGTRGSIAGLLAGMFLLPPLGPLGIVTILGGPFLGAYIGEMIGGAKNKKAFGAAFGTFIGFLAGTFVRVTASLIILIIVIINIIKT